MEGKFPNKANSGLKHPYVVDARWYILYGVEYIVIELVYNCSYGLVTTLELQVKTD